MESLPRALGQAVNFVFRWDKTNLQQVDDLPCWIFKVTSNQDVPKYDNVVLHEENKTCKPKCKCLTKPKFEKKIKSHEIVTKWSRGTVKHRFIKPLEPFKWTIYGDHLQTIECVKFWGTADNLYELCRRVAGSEWMHKIRLSEHVLKSGVSHWSYADLVLLNSLWVSGVDRLLIKVLSQLKSKDWCNYEIKHRVVLSSLSPFLSGVSLVSRRKCECLFGDHEWKGLLVGFYWQNFDHPGFFLLQDSPWRVSIRSDELRRGFGGLIDMIPVVLHVDELRDQREPPLPIRSGFVCAILSSTRWVCPPLQRPIAWLVNRSNHAYSWLTFLTS